MGKLPAMIFAEIMEYGALDTPLSGLGGPRTLILRNTPADFVGPPLGIVKVDRFLDAYVPFGSAGHVESWVREEASRALRASGYEVALVETFFPHQDAFLELQVSLKGYYMQTTALRAVL